jgi:hypothetical protein
VINFINTDSEWQYCKRLLARNTPVETRATERGGFLYADYYNGHNGRFIISAVFTKANKGGKGGVFVRSLPEPVMK